MSAPIGLTIGNALETKEAIEVLHGGGPDDTVELTLELGAEMLEQGGIHGTRSERIARIQQALDGGTALEVFRRLVEAQGGDARVVDETERLPAAPFQVPVLAGSDGGFVHRIDAFALGVLATSMGAGRTRADASIDPAVGIELAVRVGAPVERGAPLAFLHARTPDPPPRWSDVVRASVVTRPTAVEPHEPHSRILARHGS
jgi:pyrimidine-nucleoside phosphorylase